MRSRRSVGLTRSQILAALVASAIILLPGGFEPLVAQTASVGSVQLRPFVIGFVPVVGNRGNVGGVLVDAEGVVSRAQEDVSGRLASVREPALQPQAGEIRVFSPMRKISLRRLEQLILRQFQAQHALPDEVQYLAGLQRIEYIFADPQRSDIVLAGPAEGWRIDATGQPVGLSTQQAVLQLVDLVEALRYAHSQQGRQAIMCSIDPTEEGVTRVQRVLARRGWRPTPAALQQLEQLLGPHQITIQPIDPSHPTARTLVAADVWLKRLGMGLEAAPVKGLPSYPELLEFNRGGGGHNLIPRWWLAADYEPLLRDAEGLTWQLRGPGVQALAEENTLDEGRALSGSPAQQWADLFNGHFDALAQKFTAFGRLRGCMDLAVTATLLIEHDLLLDVDCPLALLMDPTYLQVAAYPVPKTVDSQAILTRQGRRQVVAISGGVELDPVAVLQESELDVRLEPLRVKAAPTGDHWWWD